MGSFTKIVYIILAVLLLSACFHKKDEDPSYTTLACASSAADSTSSNGVLTRIRSESVLPNTYQQLFVRDNAMLDYMVHDNDNPKALMILIAGGTLNATINGVEIGEPATNASGNFLVRSAHLFAQQGYKVVTMDRPEDYGSFLSGDGSKGRDMDPYRTSSAHFNDIQAIIEAENSGLGLPVVIAGTSRGTISAVAQANLADYILLSAPLTSGKGSPIGSAGVLPSHLGSKPVHLMWHDKDDCFATAPSDAISLARDINNVTSVKVTGGIDHPELSSRTSNQGCDGSKTYHGFLGIESCVVENATSWLDGLIASP